MNDNDIKLPPHPEPDGYLTIKIIGRDVEVNAYRDSTMDAYAREAVRMNAQAVPDEPDWRHPKIQGLIGSEARLRITVDLIWRILEDPNQEFTASDMEYWDTIHDRLKEALSAKPAAPQPAQVEPVKVPSEDEVLKIAIESGLACHDSTGEVFCAWREDVDISEYLIENARALLALYGQHLQPVDSTTPEQADSHARICYNLAEEYKSDPLLFAALTDAAAIIRDLLCELRRETERRWEGNRRAAQEYVEDMRDVLKEAVQICKDLDDEALAKEGRLACGAECAAAIADLAAQMDVHCEVNHE